MGKDRSGWCRAAASAADIRVAAVVLLATACGRPAGPPAPDPACVVGAGGPAGAPLVIGVTDPVDPANAPAGTNDAERLLFRQLYEPLVRRDCAGGLHPGLAEAWTAEDAGRRWTFTLRASARFWDGRPVRAREVVAAWEGRTVPWTAANVLDSLRVVIVFREPVATPLAVADPQYSVTAPAGGWPLGTTAPGRTRHRVTGDARDLADAGVDLFVTRDPTVARYAEAVGSHRVTPLPFDRVYVLTGRPEAAVTWDRSALPGAVHAAARPAGGPYWWEDESCAAPGRPPAADEIVSYRADDITARELAARVVALLGGGWEAVADRRGVARHVLALPLRPWQPCRPPGPPGGVVPLIETRAYLVHLPAVRVVIEYDGVPRIRGGRR